MTQRRCFIFMFYVDPLQIEVEFICDSQLLTGILIQA